MTDIIRQGEPFRDLRNRLNAALVPFKSREQFEATFIDEAVTKVSVHVEDAFHDLVRDVAGDWQSADGGLWRIVTGNVTLAEVPDIVEAANRKSIRVFGSRPEAVAAGQTAVPVGVDVMITLENGVVAWRGRHEEADDPLFENSPRWAVFMRTDMPAEALARQALGERVDEVREDLRRDTGSPNITAVSGADGAPTQALDPFGGFHLPGLGGRSVQDHIRSLRQKTKGGSTGGGSSELVKKVEAPAIARMSAAENAVFGTVDLFGGLHVPGGAGRSVQERVHRIEQTQREQARMLRSGLMLDAVQDLGLDRTGKYPVDRKIAEVMAKIRSQPRYYGQRATIYWPEGDYRIAESIDVLSGISHIGAGDGTRFLPYAQHAAFRYYSAVGTFLEGAVYANFVIEGENQTLQPGGIYWSRIKGFFFRRWRHCAINHVKLFNTGATSIGNDHADRCLIQNCYVENGGRLATVGTFGASGIGIGTGVLLREELIVANNMAIGCKNYSTFVERQANTDYDSQGAIFVGNVLKGSNYGFGEAGCDGTIVVGNEMRENVSGGVALHGGTVNGAHPGSRTRFADNQIIGNGGPGIKWDSSGGAGLRGYSSDGNRIEGNAGPGHQITGHATEVTEDLAIRGDEIIGNDGRGIDVVSGQFTNFDVIGTRLLNNDPGGIRLNGSIRGGRIFGASIRDLRGEDATQVESITGSGALTDFDIGEVQGVGCAPITLTGPQTRVTFGRNPGLE